MNLRIRTWPLSLLILVSLLWTMASRSSIEVLMAILAISFALLAFVVDTLVMSSNNNHKIMTWFANHIVQTTNPKNDPMPDELAALIEKEDDDPSL